MSIGRESALARWWGEERPDGADSDGRPPDPMVAPPRAAKPLPGRRNQHAATIGQDVTAADKEGRSADAIGSSVSRASNSREEAGSIGVASNQLALALLVHMLAKEADLEPGEAVWYGMDVHVYLNHTERAREQLSRTPRTWPRLRIKRKAPSLFDYTIDDFELEGYDPHPPIRYPIAV